MITIRPIPQQALDIVKQYEGFSSTAYVCPADLVTIGYGHVLSGVKTKVLAKENPELLKQLLATTVTMEEAEDTLRKDMRTSALAVQKLTRVPLTENQYAALISFVFNCGSGNYLASTLRSKLNRGEYEDAADEFLKWNKGGGRVLPGLVKRRAQERELFLENS